MFSAQRLSALLGAATLVLVTGAAGLLLGQAGAGEARRLWAGRTRLDFDDLVLAAALVVLALVAAWLCLATLLTTATLVLRCSTRGTTALATWVTPALLRRLLTVACGAAVLTAPATAPAVETTTGTSAAPPCRPLCGPPSGHLPAPLRPAPHPRPHPPQVAPALVVRPGDSLWAIATEYLPGRPSDAHTATAWPLWFRLNRARLGPDPDLIHPGTRLRVPPRFARTR
jgi:LysM domain